jgi:phosphatidylserine decarboxylase
MRLAPGGLRYTGLCLVLAVPALFFVPIAGVVLIALAAGIVLFYRDPERVPPSGGIVAPADGRVSVLREEDDRIRVGVFMNVWDVHVNRAPCPGTVEEVTHVPGAHRPAFSKESDRNEQVQISCETPYGATTVTLIAGAFARRIHPYVSAGEDLALAARISHISFGSRADVLLPESIDRDELAVDRGDRVRAGETTIAPEAVLDSVEHTS